MNPNEPKYGEQDCRRLFRAARPNDFPKRYVHKTTILVTGGADRFGDPYYVWVTASTRNNRALHLRAHLGDDNVKGYFIEEGEKVETRECFARANVASWEETKSWLNSLCMLRCQVSEHTAEELEELSPAFRRLQPEWFKVST